MSESISEDKQKEIIETALKNYKDAVAVDEDNSKDALEDLEFYDGKNQWSKSLEQKRLNNDLPCLIMNRSSNYVDRIYGDIVINRPTIKVIPVDNKADPLIADIQEGIIRNIQYLSAMDDITDESTKSSAICGRGFVRVDIVWADDESFEQEIRIKKIVNQFSVKIDPIAYISGDMRDANFGFITDNISLEKFKNDFPNAKNQSFVNSNGNGFTFDNMEDNAKDWFTSEKMRIAECFWKEKINTSKLYLYRNTTTNELFKTEDQLPLSPEYEFIKARDINKYQIKWCKMNAVEILDGPINWVGDYIPIVLIMGKTFNIGNQRKMRGVIRYLRDPQKLYDYLWSKWAEIITAIPDVPYMGTKKMIEGHETEWNNQRKDPQKIITVNVDTMFPGGVPTPMQAPSTPIGIERILELSKDEFDAVTGIYPTSLGDTSNETSGKAIVARQSQTNISNIEYRNNYVKALTYLGKIIINLIPKVMSRKKIVRITGVDGKESQTVLNYPESSEEVNKLIQEQRIDDKKLKAIDGIYNDITVGKYDVYVDSGPNYLTQRQESRESLLSLINSAPDLLKIIGDLVFKTFDISEADEISQRMRRIIPPNILNESGNAEIIPQTGQEQNAQGQGQPRQPSEEDIMNVAFKEQKIKLELAKLEKDIQNSELDANEKKLRIAKFIKELGYSSGSPPANK